MQRVRIAYAQSRQNRALQGFHALGIAIGFVVVAEQVQDAVDGHVRKVVAHRFALIECFARDDRRTEHEIAAEHWFLS